MTAYALADEKEPLSPTTPDLTGFRAFLHNVSRICNEHKLITLIFPFLVGLVFFLLPNPEGLTVEAMNLFGVFMFLIMGLLFSSFDIGVLVLFSLVFLSLTLNLSCVIPGTTKRAVCTRVCNELDPGSKCSPYILATTEVLRGYSEDIIWLVWAAFMFGKVLSSSGLGKRGSLYLVKYLGRSLLGLGYAIVLCDVFLAPFIPSNTARGGSLVLPLVISIAEEVLNSSPDYGTARSNGGEFLILCGNFANFLASTLFFTGMAANPLVTAAAKKVFGVDYGFVDWLIGSIVPATLCILVLPPLVLKLSRPTIRIESEVRAKVVKDLQAMGPLSRREWELVVVLLLCLAGWMTSGWTSFEASQVALLGVVILLFFGTIEWKEIAENKNAWSTIFWLGGFMVIARQLSYMGITDYFASQIVTMLEGIAPFWVAIVLTILYACTQYFFSSITAHILALAEPMMVAAKALGVTPMLIIPLMSYTSAICAALTNYSSGSVVIYYGSGYVPATRWLYIGFIVGVVFLTIYMGVGIPYWKLLGWW